MTALWITKCEKNGLQSAIGCGLQSVAKWITKCVRGYKVCQGGLQSVGGTAKCGGITKCGGTYLLISSYFYCMDISQLFENVCVFNKRMKSL